jgi:hypothetical protein
MHVAIIMDGNGRWAQARGLPRVAGHRRGAVAVRRTVEAALKHGVRTLTLYAFSADNWRRPPAEVSTLMRLFRDYLRKRTAECIDNGIRIAVIGRRDRLPVDVTESSRVIIPKSLRPTQPEAASLADAWEETGTRLPRHTWQPRKRHGVYQPGSCDHDTRSHWSRYCSLHEWWRRFSLGAKGNRLGTKCSHDA